MSENLMVGTHKDSSNPEWQANYGRIVKSCGCQLGSKCEHAAKILQQGKHGRNSNAPKSS